MLALLIYGIAELPLDPPIILSTSAEQELFRIHQIRWKVLSLLLRQIRLGESPSEVMLLPEVQAHKPFARWVDSLLTLAVEIYPKTEDGLIHAFGSPANLWFAGLYFLSYNSFAQALTGYPQPRAKKEAIKNARTCLQSLYQIELFKQLNLKSQRTTHGCVPGQRCPCLISWLLWQAGKIASQNPSFEKNYYRPCLRAFKKIVSSANECKDLQMVYIDSHGQLFTTKQSRKRPPSRKDL